DRAQTGSFLRQSDAVFPEAEMRGRIEARLAAGVPEFLSAATVSRALTGDVVGANILMLGIAWQKGYIPLALESIEQAIRLNSVAVEANLNAFNWGRRLGADPALAEQFAASAPVDDSLDALIEHRAGLVAAYQNRAYADRYRKLVALAREAGARAGDKEEAFARAVAWQAHRLMTYKDEYEVARLLTAPEFANAIARRFEGDYAVRFHMAPPLLSRRDPRTGHLKKRKFGPWVKPALMILRQFRFLRGTPFDPFGHTGERKAERALITEYEATIAEIAAALDAARLKTAIAIAEAPALV